MVTRPDFFASGHARGSAELVQTLLGGLPLESRRWWDGTMAAAINVAHAQYGDTRLSTGETIIAHALGMANSACALGLDVQTRIAAILFALADFRPVDARGVALVLDLSPHDPNASKMAGEITALVLSMGRLKVLRPLTLAESGSESSKATGVSQAEVLRKMVLAMSSDIRVVLLRLISRTQSLRHFAAMGSVEHPERQGIARETLAIYAPLANRLGVWQLKWELEDLSFRFIEPHLYKKIAGLLDEKRGEREAFMERVISTLRAELALHPELAGVTQIQGRPKHIYSIWNKMRSKELAFEQVHDVRALRVIVPNVGDCYTVLGVVHHLWQPIRGEFDDYIAQPKGNDYRSLHTAVLADEGRSLEVQIRTLEMHKHAELGIAAHWRYKEAGQSTQAVGGYEDKISWLRRLLSWHEEITHPVQDPTTTSGERVMDWAQGFVHAALDDTLYVMTPEGWVIDLPKGATPIDFAYRVHTDLGHRCRGARVNGQMVPLATPLASGQQVDIISVKSGGPSRDWLNPGYLVSHRARQKVRQWFAAQDTSDQLAQGRAIVQREMQRLGENHAGMESLAGALGVKTVDALYLAAARGEVGTRAIAVALRGEPVIAPEPELGTARSRADTRGGQILVVGVDNLLTQMGRCCKPMPPDAIIGFVTRGKGVSVHRIACKSFLNMAKRNPERVIGSQWGGRTIHAGQAADGHVGAGVVYAVDMQIEAADRNDLLRDISEVLTRERVAVTAMKTRSRHGVMHMALTVELPGAGAMQRIAGLLRGVGGVSIVRRP